MFLSVDDSKEWQACAFAMSENKAKFKKFKWGIAKFSNAYFCKKLSEAVGLVQTKLHKFQLMGSQFFCITS